MDAKPRRLSYFFIYLFKLVIKGLAMLLHYPYLLLARSGLFRFLVPPSTKVGVVSFNFGTESQLRMIIGSKVIGKYHYDSAKWAIEPPFRLFVDERRFEIPEMAIEI